MAQRWDSEPPGSPCACASAWVDSRSGSARLQGRVRPQVHRYRSPLLLRLLLLLLLPPHWIPSG
jgi:hypothetical protein